MDPHQAFAIQSVSTAFQKCQSAMSDFDDLVAALALSRETGRVAGMARVVAELQRQMEGLERTLGYQAAGHTRLGRRRGKP